MKAAEGGNAGVVAMLLKHGAKVDLQDEVGSLLRCWVSASS